MSLALSLNCHIFLWLADGVLQHPELPQLVWGKETLCPDRMSVPSSRKLGHISFESWEEGVLSTEEMEIIQDVKGSIFLQAV